MPPPEAIEATAAPQGFEESLEAYVLRLARAKGQAVAGLGIEGTILACDTLSEVDGEALGKPVDRDDARRMLTLLSGRVHRVLTGVWICHQQRASPAAGTAQISQWIAVSPPAEKTSIVVDSSTSMPSSAAKAGNTSAAPSHSASCSRVKRRR